MPPHGTERAPFARGGRRSAHGRPSAGAGIVGTSSGAGRLGFSDRHMGLLIPGEPHPSHSPGFAPHRALRRGRGGWCELHHHQRRHREDGPGRARGAHRRHLQHGEAGNGGRRRQPPQGHRREQSRRRRALPRPGRERHDDLAAGETRGRGGAPRPEDREVGVRHLPRVERHDPRPPEAEPGEHRHLEARVRAGADAAPRGIPRVRVEEPGRRPGAAQGALHDVLRPLGLDHLGHVVPRRVRGPGRREAVSRRRALDDVR